MLYVADRIGREERDLDSLRTPDGLEHRRSRSRWRWSRACPGRAPPSAPGCSAGFTREAAARFSFLLSIPAVVLSGVYELKDVGSGTYGVGPTIVATVLAFVTGYASIVLAPALPR